MVVVMVCEGKSKSWPLSSPMGEITLKVPRKVANGGERVIKSTIFVGAQLWKREVERGQVANTVLHQWSKNRALTTND